MSLIAANYSSLIYLTSGTLWTAPANWSSINNFIACIGTGSIGGGAYAQSNNVSLIPYHSYQINFSGSTWFGGSSLGGSIVGAQGASAQTPGQASASVGQVVFSGGNGSVGNNGTMYCGGGAAGPNGAGGPGTFPNGGFADGGVVAAVGGNQNGLSGSEFGASFGCGGGGAPGFNPSNGGNYGGGAGGEVFLGGSGLPGPGLIVIGYTPLNSPALLIGI
jgi:hypothetical protein